MKLVSIEPKKKRKKREKLVIVEANPFTAKCPHSNHTSFHSMKVDLQSTLLQPTLVVDEQITKEVIPTL